MEVSVDFSIFISATKAYGNITGSLNLPAIPTSGDFISLTSPLSHEVYVPVIDEFAEQIEIKKVIFIPGNEGRILIQLDDIVLDSENNARKLVDYLVDGFGLYFDKYDSI